MRIIKNNAAQLTGEEIKLIESSTYYMTTIVGILLSTCIWDCTDRIEAKKHLDQLGIRKGRSPILLI
jgi:hypothetical protein